MVVPWNQIGYAHIETGKRFKNYLTLPLITRYNNIENKNEYKVVYGGLFRNIYLPVITKKRKLYNNDIITIQMSNFPFKQYATGRTRI